MAKALRCVVFVAVSMTVASQAGAQTPPLTFERPPAQSSGGSERVSDPTIQPFLAPGIPARILERASIDLQGNGRPDALVCLGSHPGLPIGKGPCRMLRPQPDGSLVDITRQLFGTGALPSLTHPREIVSGDFNRDGRADIFVAAHGYDAAPFSGETNLLLISNGDGTYSDRSATLPQTSDFTHSATVGDINGDGNLDIYVGNWGGGGAPTGPYLLIGRGDGTFTQKLTGLPPSITISAAVFDSSREIFSTCLLVDIDGDAYPDLVLGAAPTAGHADNIVLFNDGTGDFTRRPRLVLPQGPLPADNFLMGDIASLDVNRDGRPDLVLLSSAQKTDGGVGLQVLVNQGSGTLVDETARLGPSTARLTGPSASFIRLADLNNDGLQDFYLEAPSDVAPRFWLNNGNGTFTTVASTALPQDLNIQSLLVVDFDGDGRPDFVKPIGTDGLSLSYQSFLNRTPRTVPSEPIIGAAIAGNAQASIFFTAPLGSGTSPITGYTATCSLGTVTGAVTRTGTGSPITVPGLTNGRRYSCSVTATNLAGTSLASGTVRVTLPQLMSLDKTSLMFAAVTTGAGFSAQTSPQTVRLTQSGAGPVTWTATSTTPWLVVSPTSGSGSTALAVSTQFASGITASQTGRIDLTFTDAANVVGPINVTLTTVSSTATASAPFGSFDTPAGDSTVLAGSIALTGWTLDNIGVKQVELWRDRQPGETTPPSNSTAGDPRNGKIFISNATFVDNARPDVEGLNPTIPSNYRAGWGYLMLTWGLFAQGNGTYAFHAFGLDVEGNTATIGTKTVVISNDTATKPFGSIDTPTIGGDASGANFGWALTPKVNGAATCKIQPSGVQYSIDSGPLQPAVYGDARNDIAGAFPGFSNTAGAGGHAIIDWTALTNGAHTIVWLITDDCNRADGVGSRFFNVTSGVSALTAPPVEFRLKAETTESRSVASAFRRKSAEGEASAFRRSDDAVLVSRGYGELPEIVTADQAGNRTIEVRQGGRIELRLPRGFESAYQLGNDGQRRALPTGTTWDAPSGIFYWQPAPGFLGRFRIVFTGGSEPISVHVVVTP